MKRTPGLSHVYLAQCCRRAYGDRGPSVLSRREVEVSVYSPAYHPDVRVLAVRGTEVGGRLSNLVDIVRDLCAIPWRCPVTGVRAHRGFMRGAYLWVDAFVRDLDPRWSYVVTGHSMGAAIAPHLARYLHLRGLEVPEVVLFAEPAGHYGGSRAHYAGLGLRTTSYRIKNDWIRTAGFGGRTVAPVLLPAYGANCWESHGMPRYVISLAVGRAHDI